MLLLAVGVALLRGEAPAVEVAGADAGLLVLVSRGCSGSTWVRGEAAALLRTLGRPVANLGEATRAGAERQTPEAQAAAAVVGGARHTLGHGLKSLAKTLRDHAGLLKAKPEDVLDPSFLPALQATHAKVSQLERENLLDVLLCAARECFATGAWKATKGLVVQPAACRSRRDKGEKVFASKRQLASSQERLVVPDPLALVRALEQQEQHFGQLQRQLQEPTVSFERLSAFEYDKQDWDTSVAEWTKLLKALGAPGPAAEAAVRERFAPAAGTFTRRDLRSVLVNYAAVHAAFAGSRSPAVRRMLE